MLQLIGVGKSHGDLTVVDDANLVVNDGEFVTLLGPSGSGKSTILGMIAGFVPPSRGQILLDGRDISRLSAAERGIGVVFQNYALFPHMTIFENIAYGLQRRRWRRDRIAARVAEMLDLIGLAHVAARRPHQLSGGQQQRVALARALAFEPSLLLMDEPLGALDREIREQMQHEIRRVHRETRPSVVYVTHNREEAFALSDRVAILERGCVMGYDTAQALYTRPPNRFVASFFGAHEIFPVEVVAIDDDGRSRIRLHGQEAWVAGSATVATPGSALLAIGSRQIRPGIHADGIVVDAELHDLFYMGDTTRAIYHLPGTGSRMIAEFNSAETPTAALGDIVRLTLDLGQAALVPDLGK